ncbi:MAG: hypothetical protein ACON4U_09230 [Myxococcota bacterium]
MSKNEFTSLETDIRRYISAHLSGKGERLERLEVLIEELKTDILIERLQKLHGVLVELYEGCLSWSITLDYVPELAMLELWGIEIHCSDRTDSWSAHWFDKSLGEARLGLWADEITGTEQKTPTGFDAHGFWRWAKSVLSFFDAEVHRLAHLADSSEGVSTFTVEQTPIGLKLTAEPI